MKQKVVKPAKSIFNQEEEDEEEEEEGDLYCSS
jgi:hypothetical protein